MPSAPPRTSPARLQRGDPNGYTLHACAAGFVFRPSHETRGCMANARLLAKSDAALRAKHQARGTRRYVPKAGTPGTPHGASFSTYLVGYMMLTSSVERKEYDTSSLGMRGLRRSGRCGSSCNSITNCVKVAAGLHSPTIWLHAC